MNLAGCCARLADAADTIGDEELLCELRGKSLLGMPIELRGSLKHDGQRILLRCLRAEPAMSDDQHIGARTAELKLK